MTARALGLTLALTALAAAAPLPAQQERFRKTAPQPEPLQEDIGLPALTAPTSLSNGLKVSVAYRDGTGFIGLELLVNAGESASPAPDPGLATFVASLLGRGAQGRSAAEIEETIEALGGTFFVTVSQDYVRISLQVLEESLDKALDLLGLILLQPQFTEREIAIVRRMITYDLQDRESSPEFVAKRQLYAILFKGHPYANQALTRKLLKTWSAREAQDFFDRFYRPNNAQLILTGNLNLSQAARKVSHVFNTWAPRDVPPSAVRPVRPPEKDRIAVVDLPSLRDACYVYVGTAFPRPATADRFALTVLNQVLGGSLGSRLLMNLREAKQYANYAFSETEFLRAAGILFVRARVLPDKVVASALEIQRELRALAGASAASPAEIEPAKTYLLGNFPIGLERFDQLTARMADIVALGAGDELWNGYYAQVKQVDADRVQKAAQAFLQLPLVTVIAGDRAALADRLSVLDTYDLYDINGQFLATYTKDKKGADHEAGGMRPEFQRRPGQE